MRTLFATLFLVFGIVCVPGFAQQTGGFGSFYADELGPPNGVATIADPTGTAPTPKVEMFTIPQGFCNDTPYEAGRADSDCFYKSARAQKAQKAHTQPKEAWYGWWVYFPSDFPFGKRQTNGHYEFAYWHNFQCPHVTFANNAGQSDALYLETNTSLGNYQCAKRDNIRVATFSELAGKWTRFEMFVRWSSSKSGHINLFINGEERLNRNMITLTPGLENTNYFKYGIYLCCTDNVANIRAMKIFFAGVRQAKSRDGLASN